jgi:hypothetical protein
MLVDLNNLSAPPLHLNAGHVPEAPLSCKEAIATQGVGTAWRLTARRGGVRPDRRKVVCVYQRESEGARQRGSAGARERGSEGERARVCVRARVRARVHLCVCTYVRDAYAGI